MIIYTYEDVYDNPSIKIEQYNRSKSINISTTDENAFYELFGEPYVIFFVEIYLLP
jgi:hypothetical protein